LSRHFDASRPVLSPRDIVSAFTKRSREELVLPERAVITFNGGDLNHIVTRSEGAPVEAWSRFKQIYRLGESRTVAVCSSFGGPNISALVEELAAFGTGEFVLWGYCGGIDPSLAIGDVLITKDALREDGVSSHYTESDDPVVSSNWFDAWSGHAENQGFRVGTAWSCDAIYRETRDKVTRYRRMGISAVEMETASFYCVCNYLGVKGVAFLVVSDLLTEDSWTPGFGTKPFRSGARRLSQFILDHAIRT